MRRSLTDMIAPNLPQSEETMTTIAHDMTNGHAATECPAPMIDKSLQKAGANGGGFIPGQHEEGISDDLAFFEAEEHDEYDEQGRRRRKPWTSPVSVLKSVGPKLVPFCKTVAIYFVLTFSEDTPTLLRCLVKCAPILCLIGFVLLHGISLSKEYAYARAILCGLVMSLMGDILLCYSLLIPGMLFFGLAQANYIRAFGLRPFKVYVAIAMAPAGAAVYCYLAQALECPMTIFLAIYMVLLSTMVWRALARVELVDELWTWTKLCSSFGAVLFMISDTMLGVHMFVSPLTYEKEIVMTTYYAAQLGIALSVVDSRKAGKKE